jgi:hypothetical protein
MNVLLNMPSQSCDQPSGIGRLSLEISHQLLKRSGDRLVRQRGIADSALAALYQSARYLVTPSLYDGFCLSLLKVQRYGCPVLFANAHGTAEMGGVGGLRFDPLDVSALARLLDRVIDKPTLRSVMRARGYRNATRFSGNGRRRNMRRFLPKPCPKCVSADGRSAASPTGLESSSGAACRRSDRAMRSGFLAGAPRVRSTARETMRRPVSSLYGAR